VLGMTELALSTPLSSEQKGYLNIVKQSGDCLIHLINDILDFSKIESGRLDLELEPFQVRSCVEEALDLVAPKAAEHGLEVASFCADDVPARVVGDVTRVRQVLVNLVANAVKFTPAGEVVVTVSATPVDTGQHELHFAVRDTGVGIPADRLDRLFQSFSQVDASTTRKYGGTGLGLAISRRLVEMMGGRMWVESAVGVGSTFHFTVVAPDAAHDSHGPAPLDAGALRGARVLIVDDNDTNRRILGLQAVSWGMEPCLTGSPAEALAWVRRGDAFSVAILDMAMPEMDGVTLACALRRLRSAAELPLVMLSSVARPELTAVAGPEMPKLFAAILTKPVKSAPLFETLRRVSNAAAPSARPSTPAAAGAPEIATGPALRILLAEDNVVNQKVAVKMLERLGHRADVAANGAEAVAAVARQRYDVVLMDVHMPEMDGLDATRRVLGAGDGSPYVIAMTAKAMQGDREECLAAGMDDYIAKPVRMEELAAALARAVRPRRREPDQPPALAPSSIRTS